MTFTKERLTELSRRENVGAILGEEIAELARIALALLEAEAVGEVVLGEYDDCGCHPDAKVVCIAADGQADWENFKDGTRLYTAHPAPVSVPAAMEIDDDFDSAFEHGKAVGWNAYRAAMLQAEPVSNSDELPLDYLQGHKDGLEWAAQLAEANHPQTGDWLYDDPIDLARAIRKGPDMPTVQAGNSPVIPDGWISCSERMPDKLIPVMVMYEDGEMWSAMWNGNRWDDGTEYPDPHSVTHWREMPAAPKQEVKS